MTTKKKAKRRIPACGYIVIKGKIPQTMNPDTDTLINCDRDSADNRLPVALFKDPVQARAAIMRTITKAAKPFTPPSDINTEKGNYKVYPVHRP